MKRKLTALILAVAMTFTATACGNQAEDTSSTETETTEKAADTQEDIAEEPAEDPEDTAKEESTMPHPRTLEFYEYVDSDDTQRTLMYTEAEFMELTEESKEAYPALAKSLEALRDERMEDLRGELQSQRTWAEEQYEYEGNDFSPYNYSSHLVVKRCDEKVLSFVSQYTGYYGGAHGFYGTAGYQFDAKTGDRLMIDDVFSDTSSLNAALKEKLYEQYPELSDEFESFDMDETLERMRYGEDDYAYEFYLTPQGITFYFDAYALTSYASGAQEVTFSYNEMRDSLNPDYLPEIDAPWYYEFRGGEYSGFLWDIDADDLQDFILLNGSGEDEYGNTYDEYGQYHGISLTVGDATLVLADEDYYYYSLIGRIYRDSFGDVYITATGTMDNDYAETYVCRYENGTLTKTDECWLRATSYPNGNDEYTSYTEIPVDPACLHLSQHFDLLSTYMAAKTYEISPEGKLVSEDEYYRIYSGDRYDLVLKKDITADIVDEDGHITLDGETIKAGTHLSLYRTDGNLDGEAAVVDLKNEEGQIVRLNVTPVYPHQVNDEDEFDVFETLYYAG